MNDEAKVEEVLSAMPSWGKLHKEEADWLILLLASFKTMLEAAKVAEAALSDIGDAEREPGDDVAWCEARAAAALPAVRGALVSTQRNMQLFVAR